MADDEANRERVSESADEAAQGVAVPPEVLVHDRIMDAYYGKMGDDFMRKTQERVHWVCAETRGARILDVGCSQGIVPILLGREGKQVLGVDTDADAIAVANAYMAAGPAHVSANVTFTVADFMAHPFDNRRFDTVVMSEVLEHLVDPAAFVSRAAQLLEDGGRLVVTVPFGINDFIDHKRTYYLAEPYRLLSRWFEIEKIQLFSRWIGFSAKRRPEAITLDEVPELPLSQILAAEQAFYGLERALTENLKKTKEQLSAANQKYRDASQNLTQLRKQLADKTAEVGKLALTHEDARSQLKKALPEMEHASSALQEKLIANARLEENVKHLQEALTASRAAEAALKSEMKEAQQQLKIAVEQAADLVKAEKQLAELEAAHKVSRTAEKSLNESVAASTRRIDDLSGRLARYEQELSQARKQNDDYADTVKRERAVVEELRASLEQQEAGYQRHVSEIGVQLEDARRRRAEVDDRNASLLRDLESSRMQREALEAEQRRLRQQQLDLQRQLATTNSKLVREEQGHRKVGSAAKQYRQWMLDERARVSFIEHTLAFQLGSILTFAFRTPADFIKTPLRLARLVRAALRRGPDGRPPRVFIPGLPAIVHRDGKDASAVANASGANGPDSTPNAPRSDNHRKSLHVDAGDSVKVLASVQYPEQAKKRDKHAVLMIRLFDASGNTLARPIPGFGHSARLNGPYRYISCTAGAVREILNYTIPEGVAKLEVEISPFNLPVDAPLSVAGLSISKTSATATVRPRAPEPLGIVGWPEYKVDGKPVVMAVMDEFTTGCFESDLTLVLPRPDNWRALADKYRPQLIFIESAWKGNGGSWQYRVAEYATRPGNEIADMAVYASDHGIPLIFWNKEDPVHHQKFMVTAKLADYIFTTDANMRESYREKTGNKRVLALPFAAQPTLHFPAPLKGRQSESCFAGSWYGDRHEKRGESMRWLLRAANRHGLVIYDRNHGTGSFNFPEEYHGAIKGGLPYKELCAEYRRYRVFLNVNSVTDSPTMFSRRVFELMACGTPVVSTAARGIEELFESNAVWLVDDEGQAEEAIRTLLEDDREWRRRSLSGIRDVFAHHTYARRLNQVFEQVGLDTRLAVDPKILLVAQVASEGELDRVIDAASRQRYSALELRVAAPIDHRRTIRAGNAEVTVMPLAQWHAEGISGVKDSVKAVGWLSAAASYGPGYVRDLANAMVYQPVAEGWGKALDEDVFGFGAPGSLLGSIWVPGRFHTQGGEHKPISDPRFFVADSAEFAAPGKVPEVL